MSSAGSRAEVVADEGRRRRTSTRRGRRRTRAEEVVVDGGSAGSATTPDGDEGGLRRHGAERRSEGERSVAAGRRRRDAACRWDRGGKFLGKEFTDLVDGKGIVHDLTCPYTPQQNGMAEWEMRTTVKSVRTMLLHMGMQHHWWHLALRQAVWVRNCLERSTTPPGTTPYRLLTRKKPDLMLARVLDLTNNKVVTSVEVIFYETLSLEVWKAKYGPASGRTQAHPPPDTATATVPLLAEFDKPTDEDVVEGSLEASPVAPATSITGGRQGVKLVNQDGKSSMTGEQQTGEPVEQEAAAGVQSTGEQQTGQSTGELSKSAGGEQLVDDLAVDKEGELSAGEESTDNDVVEVPITKPELRRTSRT
ncbi:unnamed protein product [Closterium sp. NIES-53]